MSWSREGKKEGVFCTIYFVRIFLTFRIHILLHIKKHYFLHFFVVFNIVESLQCILNSENIEILNHLSAVQIDIRKLDLLWNEDECQHSDNIFVKYILNPFHSTDFFSRYPLKISESQRFPDAFRRHRNGPVL